MMHEFKKYLLDLLSYLQWKGEKSHKSLKIVIFPFDFRGKYTQTHTRTCTHIRCEESSIPGLFKYKDFQGVMKSHLKKIPPF